PEYRSTRLPVRAFEKVVVLPVAAKATEAAELLVAQAVHPLSAEWVVEDGAAVAGRTAFAALRPVEAVGRRIQHQRVLPECRQLEAEGRVALVMVEPDRVRVAEHLRDHHVRARDRVYQRPLPREAVVRDRVARVALVSAHVPHLEDAVG